MIKFLAINKRLNAAYANQDFSTNLKIRFVFYLCLVLFILDLVVVPLAIMKQLADPALHHIQWQSVILELITALFYLVCMVFILKGHYRVVSSIFLYFVTAFVWLSIITASSEFASRLYLMNYVILIIAITPIILIENKYLILIFTLINLGLGWAFVLGSEFQELELVRFIISAGVPFIIMGLVAYYNFGINKKALDKANADVKAKAEIEECLATSERKFRQMTELLPQTIFETDLKGTLTYVNLKGLQQFGYEYSDFEKGVNVISTIHPDDHDKLKQNIFKVLSGKESTGNHYTAIRKDKTTFPCEVYAAPIIVNNQPVGIRGVIIDVSDREKAEQEKRESEERFGAMIEFLPYVVMVTDVEGRFLIVNEAFCKEFNCTKEQAYGKTTAELGYFVDEGIQKRASELIQQTGVAENIEATVTRKDKSTGWAYFSSKVVKLSQQTVILSSSVNITEKKQTEQELDLYRQKLELLVKERTEELAEANNELGAINEEMKSINEELLAKNDIIKLQNEELQRALQHLKETQSHLIQSEKMASLGVLTSGVAHEINNPLNFIVGGYYALEEILNDPKQSPNPNIDIVLTSIKTGVERVTKIVSSLNEFSRGNSSFDEHCNLHAIIDNCLVMLNSNVLHRIEVEREYQPKDITLKGNSGQLHQVFINILNNAIQSIPDKGKISIKTFSETEQVGIEIKDTGSGIAPDILHRIMDPFFTTKDPGQGTGLGLSITYNILKDHQGDIKFESEPGKGTKVTILFKTQLV